MLIFLTNKLAFNNIFLVIFILKQAEIYVGGATMTQGHSMTFNKINLCGCFETFDSTLTTSE